MLFRKKFLILALIFITGSAGFIALRNTGTTEHPVQMMSSGLGEPDNTLLTHRIIMTDQHYGLTSGEEVQAALSNTQFVLSKITKQCSSSRNTGQFLQCANNILGEHFSYQETALATEGYSRGISDCDLNVYLLLDAARLLNQKINIVYAPDMRLLLTLTRTVNRSSGKRLNLTITVSRQIYGHQAMPKRCILFSTHRNLKIRLKKYISYIYRTNYLRMKGYICFLPCMKPYRITHSISVHIMAIKKILPQKILDTCSIYCKAIHTHLTRKSLLLVTLMSTRITSVQKICLVQSPHVSALQNALKKKQNTLLNIKSFMPSPVTAVTSQNTLLMKR